MTIQNNAKSKTFWQYVWTKLYSQLIQKYTCMVSAKHFKKNLCPRISKPISWKQWRNVRENRKLKDNGGKNKEITVCLKVQEHGIVGKLQDTFHKQNAKKKTHEDSSKQITYCDISWSCMGQSYPSCLNNQFKEFAPVPQDDRQSSIKHKHASDTVDIAIHNKMPKKPKPNETNSESANERERERNVLFNDALNTFYLQLYGVRHMVKDHSDRHIGYSYWLTTRLLLYASSHRHWLEREIAQWVYPMKDRSDDPSHHERTLYLWVTSRSRICQWLHSTHATRRRECWNSDRNYSHWPVDDGEISRSSGEKTDSEGCSDALNQKTVISVKLQVLLAEECLQRLMPAEYNERPYPGLRRCWLWSTFYAWIQSKKRKIGNSYYWPRLFKKCWHRHDTEPTKMLKDSQFEVNLEKWKEKFYLMTHSTHFIYGYLALDIW